MIATNAPRVGLQNSVKIQIQKTRITTEKIIPTTIPPTVIVFYPFFIGGNRRPQFFATADTCLIKSNQTNLESQYCRSRLNREEVVPYDTSFLPKLAFCSLAYILIIAWEGWVVKLRLCKLVPIFIEPLEIFFKGNPFFKIFIPTIATKTRKSV